MAGDRVPNIALQTREGKMINLEDLWQHGSLILSFHRQWCPYDNLELWELQQDLPTLQTPQASLVIISPQPDPVLLPASGLNAQVLRDAAHQVARAFGLVRRLPATLRRVYSCFEVDVSACGEEGGFDLTIPATYVIAPSGKIAYAFVDPGYVQPTSPVQRLLACDEEYWLDWV